MEWVARDNAHVVAVHLPTLRITMRTDDGRDAVFQLDQDLVATARKGLPHGDVQEYGRLVLIHMDEAIATEPQGTRFEQTDSGFALVEYTLGVRRLKDQE